PLGQSILGTADSIRALTRDQMADYFARRYAPTNVTLAAAGNLDWPRLVELAEAACGAWQGPPAGRDRRRAPGGPGQLRVVAEELQQAKSKILSRVVRSSERPAGRMRALGAAWTYLHQYRSVDDELQAFDAVTLETIREVLERFPLDRPTPLAYGPLAAL